MENNDVLKDENKMRSRGCSGCLKVVASTLGVLILTMYGYFYTQRNGPHGFGPYTGAVLDAETREPIEDAQVYLNIDTETFSEVIKGFGKIYDYYYSTDSKGRYRIRKHIFFRGYIKEYSMELIIYKAGYVSYSSWHSFTSGSKPNFKNNNNVVLLERWDEKKFSPKDHSRHMGYLDGALKCEGRKSRKFCEEAREEMILGCMYKYYPRNKTRNICEEIVDRKINNN